MAAAIPRLHDVEGFARARPQELGIGPGIYELSRGLHYRHWVDAGIGDPSGENRDDQPRVAGRRSDDGFDLIEGKDRGHVQ